MSGEEKRLLIEEHVDEEVMIFDGLDDAIVGFSEQQGMPSCVVYDKEKCLKIYQSQGMSYEEALEWFYFNVVGLGGNGSPVFITRLDDIY
jgi:hypothetical protein